MNYKQLILENPVLTQEEEEELFTKAKNGDAKAREKLIYSNIGLVMKAAHKYQSPVLEFEDIVQEGMCGLIRAVDLYDNTQGTKFSSYAYMSITSKIIRAFDYADLIQIPVHVQIQKRKEKRKGEEVTKTPITLITLDTGQKNKLESYDQGLNHGTRSFIENVEDETAADKFEKVLDKCNNQKLRTELEKLMTHCKPNTIKLVKMRFGFNGEPMTYRQIANEVGKTQQNIHNLVSKALVTMRKYSTDDLRLFA